VERTWLVFRLGPCVLCASALDVEGIIQRPPALTKFPLTPDYALGAFLFRGQTAAAISLRRKLKLRQGEDSAAGPFIVARIGDALVAFWVDEVKEVMEGKDADWRPMPGKLAGGLFEGFAIRGGELVLQTSFAALFQAQVEFESVAAWAGARADTQAASPVAEQPSVLPAAAVSPGPVEVVRETHLPQFDLPRRQPARPVSVARRAPRERAPIKPIPAAPSISVAPACPPAPAAMASRESQRKASPLRCGLAAAGVMLAAVVAILHALSPGAEREAPPVPITRIAGSSVPEPVLAHAPAPEAAPRSDPAPVVKPAGARIHVVARGDTLWDIAKKHVGDPLRYPELAKQSNLRDPHLIHPGDRVRIEIQERK
jgi:chemotaxis signal transduction protein